MLVIPVWVVFSLPLDNKYNKTPLVRFICSLTSHIYFMIIHIVVACVPIHPIYRDSMLPYWEEWLLVVWLSGLLLEQLSVQQDRSGMAKIKVCYQQIEICTYNFHPRKSILTYYFEWCNQYLGSKHRHAMFCGNHSRRSFYISGRGRLEATRLHSKSVCWCGVPGVLRSGKL